MSDTSTLLLVIMTAVLVSMVLAIVIVRRSQVRASRTLADLGAAALTTAATGMGMSGDDAPPLRGTGTLVLTDTEVAFAQWRPEHLLRIPRSAVTSAEGVREHLGKTLKTDVLRITWREPGAGGGGKRSVAFFIRDLEPWLSALG